MNEGLKVGMKTEQYLARAVLHPSVVVADLGIEDEHDAHFLDGQIVFDNYLHLKVIQ